MIKKTMKKIDSKKRKEYLDQKNFAELVIKLYKTTFKKKLRSEKKIISSKYRIKCNKMLRSSK